MADPVGTAGRPVVPGSGALRPLGINEVRLEPGFWADRQRLGGEVVIDHCRSWMTRLGWVGNFRIAAEGRPLSDRRGREFSDSEATSCWRGSAGRRPAPAPRRPSGGSRS